MNRPNSHPPPHSGKPQASPVALARQQRLASLLAPLKAASLAYDGLSDDPTATLKNDGGFGARIRKSTSPVMF